MPARASSRTCLTGLGLLLVILTVSVWQAYDRLTWFLEVIPILVVVPVLVFTYRRYPLTNLLYLLIFLHALILIGGATYTYARVPIGFDVAHWLGQQRNPYDKLGHLAQGFVPVLVTREILIRGAYARGKWMLPFLAVCVVLAASAAYELFEWGAAVTLGQSADDFLGTQGDPWDTQSDMFCALLGSVVALVTLTRSHDRQLSSLASRARQA
jgi:putative membrane protein